MPQDETISEVTDSIALKLVAFLIKIKAQFTMRDSSDEPKKQLGVNCSVELVLWSKEQRKAKESKGRQSKEK